tara:strand:+ start:281 stop:1261 length:981 start_codon:yes stop_codon:yes gene_type:complete
MNILITGAGALLGQGILKSMQYTGSDKQNFIGMADPSPTSAGLYWGNASHIIPLANDPNYISELIAVIIKNNYEILIPGTDIELPILSKYKKLIEAETNCKLVISDKNVIEIANDKYLTFQFLERELLNPPKSCLPGDFIEFSQITNFPYIVKPRDGARSVGIYIVKNVLELKKVLNKSKNPLIQEYISDENGEYTAGSFTLENKCISNIIMRRELRDGNTYKAKIYNDKNISQHIEKITNKLKPFGPCNFQFRIDNNGLPRIFEINARFSGTTIMRVHADFNEVDWIVQYFSNKQIPTIPDEFKELTFMRYFDLISIPINKLKKK